MKVYTLTFLNQHGNGELEAFTARAKAERRMKMLSEGDVGQPPAQLIIGIEEHDFPGNLAGLIMAMITAAKEVPK